MWLLVASTFALSGIAAAQSGAVAPGPAPGPFGVVRDRFRKFVSVFGNVFIADETTYIDECAPILKLPPCAHSSSCFSAHMAA